MSKLDEIVKQLGEACPVDEDNHGFLLIADEGDAVKLSYDGRIGVIISDALLQDEQLRGVVTSAVKFANKYKKRENNDENE